MKEFFKSLWAQIKAVLLLEFLRKSSEIESKVEKKLSDLQKPLPPPGP